MSPLLLHRCLISSSQCATSALQCTAASYPLLLLVASCSPADCHVIPCLAASTSCHLTSRHHLTCPSSAPTFICTGWLSCCISSCCHRLPSSCQQCCLLTHHHLTSRRHLHLPFAFYSPQLVATLSLVVSLPHIRQLALPSASASCCILFSSTPVCCCVVSHQPVTLQLPPSIASPTNGWFLRLLPALSSATCFHLLPHPHKLCDHQRCKCNASRGAMAVAEVWQHLLESAPGNTGDDGIQSFSPCCVVGGSSISAGNE